MVDPFKTMIHDLGRQTPSTRSNRTFYIDDDVYEWLQSRYGNSRGISHFVRNMLRKCMEIDSGLENQTK